MRWTGRPVFVLDPALDPAVGGNPDVLGRPPAQVVGIGHWWRSEAFPGSGLSYAVICAATDARLQALRLLATGVDEWQEALEESGPIGPFELTAWRALSPMTWSSTATACRLPPKPASADWLVRAAAERMKASSGVTMEEGAVVVWRCLGLASGDAVTAAQRSYRRAKHSNLSLEAEANLAGTSVAASMAETLATAARNKLQARAA